MQAYIFQKTAYEPLPQFTPEIVDILETYANLIGEETSTWHPSRSSEWIHTATELIAISSTVIVHLQKHSQGVAITRPKEAQETHNLIRLLSWIRNGILVACADTVAGSRSGTRAPQSMLHPQSARLMANAHMHVLEEIDQLWGGEDGDPT